MQVLSEWAATLKVFEAVANDEPVAVVLSNYPKFPRYFDGIAYSVVAGCPKTVEKLTGSCSNGDCYMGRWDHDPNTFPRNTPVFCITHWRPVYREAHRIISTRMEDDS